MSLGRRWTRSTIDRTLTALCFHWVPMIFSMLLILFVVSDCSRDKAPRDRNHRAETIHRTVLNIDHTIDNRYDRFFDWSSRYLQFHNGTVVHTWHNWNDRIFNHSRTFELVFLPHFLQLTTVTTVNMKQNSILLLSFSTSPLTNKGLKRDLHPRSSSLFLSLIFFFLYCNNNR